MTASAGKAALQALDVTRLQPIVQQALEAPVARILTWAVTSLAISGGAATGGIYRLGGSAAVGAAPARPWSVILKILRQHAPEKDPLPDDPQHALYWKREALAYSTDLLTDLPGGLSAPRCYAIWEQPDESCWLWLEDVRDRYGPVWPLDQFARAARCLGRFNGAYLVGRPIPPYPWLHHNGTLVANVGPLEAMVRADWIANPMTWTPPLIRAAFPLPVAERLLRLWAARAAFRTALARQPRTLGHLDAWRDNLFALAGTSARLVAIDWAGVGLAELGADASDLFAASFSMDRVTPADPQALDTTVFDNYVAGLHDVGWQGDTRLLRGAYSGYAALKYTVLLGWLPAVGDPQQAVRWESQSGRSLAAFVHQQARLIYYLLDLAEAALQPGD